MLRGRKKRKKRMGGLERGGRRTDSTWIGSKGEFEDAGASSSSMNFHGCAQTRCTNTVVFDPRDGEWRLQERNYALKMKFKTYVRAIRMEEELAVRTAMEGA